MYCPKCLKEGIKIRLRDHNPENPSSGYCPREQNQVNQKERMDVYRQKVEARKDHVKNHIPEPCPELDN